MFRLSDLNPAGNRVSGGEKIDENLLAAIPPASRFDFELKEKEMKSARKFIYAVNKINKMRFMTRWDNPILMVWRIK